MEPVDAGGAADWDGDDVVVGGGAAGLSAALLLSAFGRRVLLVECAEQLGGSLARFRRGGLDFDTGFHFSAGLQPGGLMSDLLRILGVPDAARVVALDPQRGQVVRLESSGHTYELPVGAGRLEDYLTARFPAEAAAVRAVVARMRKICECTPLMDLRRLDSGASGLPEDQITLRAPLEAELRDPELRALLGLFCMCHGSAPAEVSFAAHSRIAIPLFDSVARLDGGGRALADALAGAVRRAGVTVRCGRRIARLGALQDRCCRELWLDAGERVRFRHLLFTTHPRIMLESLPPEVVRPAFRDRVEAFTPSVGFFALYARLRRAPGDPDWCRSVTSLLPDPDLDRLLQPAWEGDGAVVIMGGDPGAVRPEGEALHVLETTPVEPLARWGATRRGARPPDYEAYKRQRTARLLQRLEACWPGLGRRLEVVATASALTHRDYLHSPDGSAYGIRQRVGQFNLLGRLPVRNFLAAGQSSVLPGVLGTMMTSLTVCRSLVGAETFDRWLRERLAA